MRNSAGYHRVTLDYGYVVQGSDTRAIASPKDHSGRDVQPGKQPELRQVAQENAAVLGS